MQGPDGLHPMLLKECTARTRWTTSHASEGMQCTAMIEYSSNLTGVCKYYIGPIGDLSLSTATAAAACVYTVYVQSLK